MNEVFSGLLVFSLSLCVSGLGCFILNYYHESKNIQRVVRCFESYHYVTKYPTTYHLGTQSQIKNKESFNRKLNQLKKSNASIYIKDSVADFYKSNKILNYDTGDFIHSSVIIQDDMRFNNYKDKSSECKFFRCYKNLHQLSEYFSDVDNPTQIELEYIRMVLSKDELSMYKEFNL